MITAYTNLTALTSLFGPVKRVGSVIGTPYKTRVNNHACQPGIRTGDGYAE